VLVSLFAAASLGVWVAACVGDDATPAGGGDTGMDGGGGPGSDGSVGPGTDGSVMPGSDSGMDAGCTVAPACADNGASLSCGASKVACANGCAPPAGSTAAHCRVFDPTGSVEPSDLSQTGLMDFTGKNLKFFTETGRITTTDEATEIRPANATATVEEVSANGIGFRLVPGKLGIFQFKNFTLQATTNLGEVNGATGTVALAIVAAEEVKIEGVLDLGCGNRLLTPYYPSAGSHDGSGTPADTKTQLDGMGPGGGKAGGKSAASGGNVISGGGGAGHGASGGQGGSGLYPNEAVVFGGNGGASYDDIPFDPPLGGSGGGSGGGVGGGAGGGAVQIVAGVRITIGDSPDAGGAIQGINVGGCGGSDSLTAAAGGGAGGTILLEAPEVVGKANAGVASNGGGGGGPATMFSNGSQNGSISSTPAQGEGAIDCTAGGTQAFGAGGNGGAGASPSGGQGGSPGGACAANATKYGGGGGGAAGHVRILTASGDITAAPSFVISPTVAPAFQKAKIATR
jgi:hypothetical protein